jgi:hypothetical protein
MAAIIGRTRRARASREHIGPCARCGLLSALPLGPLCTDCHQADELDRDLAEATGW